MKCKHCKNDIPDNSIFCLYCGERVVKERKKKDEIKVPAPRQLKSGKWNIELRAEGQSITEDTAEQCTAKAKAIRAGFVEVKKRPSAVTLEKAIDNYIEVRSNVLSPSTLVGYKSVKKNRFKSVMQCPVAYIKDWQEVINAEAAICFPKTVIEHFAEVKLTVSELQRTVGGSSSFKHTQIMTALTPMNAIIAESGGQNTNVISSQKATRQVFLCRVAFLIRFPAQVILLPLCIRKQRWRFALRCAG